MITRYLLQKLIRDIESEWCAELRVGKRKCGFDVRFQSRGRNKELALTSTSKSLIKSVSKHAEDHYPSSSYGVYPIENDEKIAIVLVANKYSPNNFW